MVPKPEDYQDREAYLKALREYAATLPEDAKLKEELLNDLRQMMQEDLRQSLDQTET